MSANSGTTSKTKKPRGLGHINYKGADVKVCGSRESTIFTFIPLTPKAEEWIDNNIKKEDIDFGHTIYVEHRYANNIAVGMRRGGLVVV